MTMERGIKGRWTLSVPADPAGAVFVSLGLPDRIATAFAGAHPVIALRVDEISANRLASLNIAIMACPLMAEDFDAMMVVQALKRAGYRGALSVIAPRLPDVAMVERELRALSPDIGVTIISA